MRYLCHPGYKYTMFVVSIYLILRYIMKVDIEPDNIKGIVIVSTIVMIILDLITIENYHHLLFKKDLIGEEPQEEKVYKPIHVPMPTSMSMAMGTGSPVYSTPPPSVINPNQQNIVNDDVQNFIDDTRNFNVDDTRNYNANDTRSFIVDDLKSIDNNIEGFSSVQNNARVDARVGGDMQMNSNNNIPSNNYSDNGIPSSKMNQLVESMQNTHIRIPHSMELN